MAKPKNSEGIENCLLPTISIFLCLTLFLGIAIGQTSSRLKTILGQPFNILAEETISYPGYSFRQVWESCFICLLKLDFKLRATAFVNDEHVILASKKIPDFRFMGQERQGVSLPSSDWLSEGLFYFQLQISEENRVISVCLQLGTDKSLVSKIEGERRAERILSRFLAGLKESLKTTAI